jgi:chromosome partitioning protein
MCRRTEHRMKISIVNRKGGVAKSTTTINPGAALARARHLGIARRDYRTLAVDMDPQASASFALGGGREGEGPHLGHMLLRGAAVEEALRPTDTPGLSLVAACEALGDEEELLRLGRVDGMRLRLRDALARMEAPFDFVLLDCPPGIGLPMTLTLVAADHFLIPTKVERFSLHGMGRLFAFMERLISLRRGSPEPMATILGILLTDLDYRVGDTAEREAAIRASYEEATRPTNVSARARTASLDALAHPDAATRA